MTDRLVIVVTVVALRAKERCGPMRRFDVGAGAASKRVAVGEAAFNGELRGE